MEIKLTIIAPFVALLESAREVVEERFDEWQGKVDIRLLDSSAINADQNWQEIIQGTDVIISRGATAARIQGQVNIPVVSIQVTAVDIMQALKQVSAYQGHVAVIGFPGIVYECEKVGELMGIPIQDIPVNRQLESYDDAIKKAIQDGANVVIGDNRAASVADELGIRGIRIGSAKNAIYKAIKEAEAIALVRRKEAERANLLGTIIESSTDGIIAIDQNAKVTIFNPVAAEVFKTDVEQVAGKDLTKMNIDKELAEVLHTGVPQVAEIKKMGNKTLAIKRIPIKVNDEVVGAVASFQDVTQLQMFEQVIRQKLHNKGFVAKATLDNFIGSSLIIQQLKEQARKFAVTDSTILITGESGCGKEMLAQSIHNLSKRKMGPFVAVNCGAIPENLLESELFGYEQGAFTGAKKGGKAGLFELAHGGTLFLDEIGEMPMALQSRLLRVLQEKEVMRLGADRVIPVDARVISATNQELEVQVDEKRFRSDLYYRINVLRLCIPPLRDRTEDLPQLVASFIQQKAHLNPVVVGLSPQALRWLQLHKWSGNIRELTNVIERVMLLATTSEIGETEVAAVLTRRPLQGNGRTSSVESLEEIEKETVIQFLKEEGFNYSKVAARIGITRQTLWRKLKAWNIRK